MKSGRCKYCNKVLVSSYGDMSSKVVVISDYPLFDDVRNGLVYSGTYGEALRQEMGKAGIQAQACKMITMWQHAPDEECDAQWHINQALEDMMDAKLILMLGTECLQAYSFGTANEYSGTIVKSKFLKKAVIVAGPSYAAIGKTPLGELRLALELFAKQRRKLK